MPGSERCHATGRLINDKFATLIRKRAARLEQHNSGWIVEPGAQGIGNTFGDLAAHAQLMDGLEQRVFGRLPDETMVLPGHGDATTLGRERPQLQEWRERGW